MDAGLIAGGDMTPEAALSKLSYVLAKKDLSLDGKKKVCFSSPRVTFMLIRYAHMAAKLVSLRGAVQLMAQNLRGEMSLDFAGTKLCLSDSRFIQVIAKSLSISCKEVSVCRFKRQDRMSPRSL